MVHLLKFSIAIILFSGLLSCKQSSVKCNEGLDLLQYGIPYILNCPLDVTTQKIGQGSLYYVAIRNAKGYDLQVFMSPATTNNLSTLRQRKKTELLSNPQFVKIIEEYNEGFLYEKNLDGLSSSYDFIYFVVKGDNEINFQCGNSKAFSEQEVRSMLESVRN